MKKPHPRDYGFENESEVRLVVTNEDQRRANISRVGLLSFLIAFCVSAPCAFLILASMVSLPSLEGQRVLSLVQLLYVVFSAAAGFVLGLTISFAARALAERLWQPSSRYTKAKQYLDANWMWKQILQREYGYES
jgi:cytochrome c biogenesis protein CcdA